MRSAWPTVSSDKLSNILERGCRRSDAGKVADEGAVVELARRIPCAYNSEVALGKSISTTFAKDPVELLLRTGLYLDQLTLTVHVHSHWLWFCLMGMLRLVR